MRQGSSQRLRGSPSPKHLGLIGRAVVAGGAIAALYLLVLAGLLWIPSGSNGSRLLEGSLLLIYTALASPLILLLLVLASILSCRIRAGYRYKVILVCLNVAGVIVAGILVHVLVGLWLMGPINPG